jgi:hypothetical protein
VFQPPYVAVIYPVCTGGFRPVTDQPGPRGSATVFQPCSPHGTRKPRRPGRPRVSAAPVTVPTDDGQGQLATGSVLTDRSMSHLQRSNISRGSVLEMQR